VTQNWGEAYQDNGSRVQINMDTLMEYLRKKKLALYIVLFGERSRINQKRKPDFDYKILNFQDNYLLYPNK